MRQTKNERNEEMKRTTLALFRLIWEATMSACQRTQVEGEGKTNERWMNVVGWEIFDFVHFISFGMFCMICSFRPCIIRFSFLPQIVSMLAEENSRIRYICTSSSASSASSCSNYAVNILQNTKYVCFSGKPNGPPENSFDHLAKIPECINGCLFCTGVRA